MMTNPRWFYLACVADRHYDPEFRLFNGSVSAKEWTLERFQDSVANPRNIAEEHPAPPFLACWSYGNEEDHAWVMAIEEPVE
jgi:hypothetical protein